MTNHAPATGITAEVVRGRASILVRLLDAAAARKQFDLYVEWMAEVLGRREAEIVAGFWPGPIESSGDGGQDG